MRWTRRLTAAMTVAVATGAVAAAGASANTPTVSASAATTSAATTSAATTSAAKTSTSAWHPPACTRGVTSPVQATQVTGSTSDWDVTSFDGTAIRVHWFPVAGASPSHPAPTVFMGPGWGSPGDVDTTSGVIPALWKAGYNVLTWDPRGFGQSGGVAQVDSPDFEAHDVSRIIDWVSGQTGVQLDHAGDPRMGMVGGSYGGGIQWITAATDCRVDAIAPQISWNSLVTSLDKSGTYKSGWAGLLIAVSASDHVAPQVTDGAAQANGATGVLSTSVRDWFASRGPSSLISKVRIPTLIEQGTVDTLFTLQEATRNWQLLSANHVPAAMFWYCGGHGVCLGPQGDPNAGQNADIAWLNRWVKRDTSVKTGPVTDIIDQRGIRYSAATYPIPTGTPLTATGSGALKLVAKGGAGPAVDAAAAKDPQNAAILTITPGKASNAVNLTIRSAKQRKLAVGAPQLSLTYSGKAGTGQRPERVFAQLVDDSTGRVVGNQITPVAVVLDGKTHTASLPLEMISQSIGAGQRLTLQLVATTVAYEAPQLGGSVKFSKIAISIPTAKAGAVKQIG